MALALKILRQTRPRRRVRVDVEDNLDLDIYVITELGFPAA